MPLNDAAIKAPAIGAVQAIRSGIALNKDRYIGLILSSAIVKNALILSSWVADKNIPEKTNIMKTSQ